MRTVESRADGVHLRVSRNDYALMRALVAAEVARMRADREDPAKTASVDGLRQDLVDLDPPPTWTFDSPDWSREKADRLERAAAAMAEVNARSVSEALLADWLGHANADVRRAARVERARRDALGN